MSSKIIMENPFSEASVAVPEENNKEIKKGGGHKFIVMPDGTLSEETTPEEYQEIKEDSK